MASVLGGLDAVTAVLVLANAAGYLSALGAAGTALFLALYRGLGRASRRTIRALALGLGGAGIVFVALSVPPRAAYLAGGDWTAALDPFLLRLVLDGPVGTAALARAAGLLVLCLAVWRASPPAAALGALAVAVSHALYGHALGEPRFVLGALVSAHTLAAAFWIGALIAFPVILRRENAPAAGEVAARFGAHAVWVVGALVASGAALFVLLAGASLAVLETPYGRFMALKLGLVLGLMALAALNKLRLSPALRAGTAGAADRLRLSVLWEGALVVLIALTTAALTTLTSPQAEPVAGLFERTMQ